MKNDPHIVKEDRSLGSLISGLAHDVSTLIRKERELARTEVSEKVSQAVSGMVYLAIAAVLLLGAFMALLDAAIYGLSEVMSPWLAALIVGIVVAVIGIILLQKGRNDLKAKNLMPEKTIASVKRDTEFAKEKVHDNQWNPKNGSDRNGDSTDTFARR